MAEIKDLQISDANNTALYPPGTMTIPQLDDSGRSLCGMIARKHKDNDGSNVTTGTGSAYTLVLNQQGVTVVADTGQICVRFHVANAGAATFNGKALTKRGGAALVVGDILTNDLGIVVYNPARDHFQLMSAGA